ncbi:hypothetical protein CF394_00810 [Tetzosporium hominis]|uniref:Uncharacterized protein n=1 Tax=Tetzosporium hominis TaxID=2020506 RepID=A0A264W7A5_9BACL|nr:hypothetical protein [Tetzosporium hominis]OZS79478.1 hypothetical protein CF394_00810 [Tetzosporium hominis]
MNKTEKDILLDEFYESSELYEHLATLHQYTIKLCREIISVGIESIELKELRIAELFTIYNSAKLFLSIKGDLTHYEFTSLLSFWKNLYTELVSLAEENDQNTTHLDSLIDEFDGQFKIVKDMLLPHIESKRKAAENIQN